MQNVIPSTTHKVDTKTLNQILAKEYFVFSEPLFTLYSFVETFVQRPQVLLLNKKQLFQVFG